MKGLNTDFKLEKGKFILTEGVERSRDAIWFYCIFDKFRVYVSDFGANIGYLLQRPISMLILNKTIIFGNLKSGIQKFIPNVAVTNLDIGKGDSRKDLILKIEYKARGYRNDENFYDVTFV